MDTITPPKPFKARHGGRIAVLLAALAGCGPANAGDEAKPDGPPPVAAAPRDADRATRVEVATVEPTLAGLSLELPGEVEGSRDAMLASPLGGYVEAVAVKVGDEVKAGQALVRVDASTHAARAAQARVELRAAERELERARALSKSLPQAQLDAAEVRFAAAKAAYDLANVSVGRSVIHSPFKGVIVQVEPEVGEVAQPGAPLVRVVQLDPIKVTVSLSDRDVVALREGQAAQVSAHARSEKLDAKLVRIRRAADLRTRSFIAEVEVDNADRQLLPGMIARVHLAFERTEPAMVLSQDWLVTGLREVGVFVERDGLVRFRPITLGQVMRRRVVVESGIEPGDRIVTTGHRELADGDRVIVARQGRCCTEDFRIQYD